MSEVSPFPSIPTKIQLPIDFSPSSKAALVMATDLALHFHAELFLVNVIPLLVMTTVDYSAPDISFPEKMKVYAEQQLAKIHAFLSSKGVRAISSIEVGNDIAGSIMEVADREHIDMVVISTHGISGWHPLIFGSIAEKVVKLAQCPLLLLRSAKPNPDLKTSSNRSME
jgi:nucleotide-binding universal stress UspA family protein